MNKSLLKQLYSAFLHSYLSYGNLVWGSTHRSKLETLYRHQKHAVRIINFKDRFTHSKPLFVEMKILNLYELNVFQVLSFMLKCKLGILPKIFQDLFTYKPHNQNLLKSQSLLEPIIKSKIEEFSICYRGPHLWNKIIVQKGKGILFTSQGGRRHATSKAKQRAVTHFPTSRQMVK